MYAMLIFSEPKPHDAFHFDATKASQLPVFSNMFSVTFYELTSDFNVDSFLVFFRVSFNIFKVNQNI